VVFSKRVRWFDMSNLVKKTLGIVAAYLLSSAAIACSACLRDILSPEEFDRRGWDSSAHVFVGLVVRSELVRGENEILYAVDPEEVFKGDPTAVNRISSRRHIDEWGGLQAVSCGDAVVSAGDRVLIFASADGRSNLGRCSESRVIERASGPISRDDLSTLERLRDWAVVTR
jgi:hypothetical protein